MATITAVTSSVMGEYLNVLDPTTWVGGVVPGPGDTAVFPARVYTFYRNTSNNTDTHYNFPHPLLRPWTGSNYAKMNTNGDIVSRQVQFYLSSMSTLGLVPTGDTLSGSVYCTLYPYYNPTNLIKIDFTGSNGTTLLYTCSIDTSYRDWKSEAYQISSGSPMDHDHPDGLRPAYGRFHYNGNYFIRNLNQYELTGSGEWAVDHIDMNYFTDFKIKDDAKLYLTATAAGDAYIDMSGTSNYSSIQVYDQAHMIISGGYGTTQQSETYVGIKNYNKHGCSIVMSGSSNYSSSLISASTSTGDTTFDVVDETAFGPGDIVSIQSNLTDHYIFARPNPETITYTNPQITKNHGTASITGSRTGPPASYQEDPHSNWYTQQWIPHQQSGSSLNDEWTKIVTRSNNTAVAEKLLTRRGWVEYEIGSYQYKDFVEEFFESDVDPFTGIYKAIAVDSIHKDYKKGDNIIINDTVYNVKAVSTTLTQSMLADFTKGDVEPKDIFLNIDNCNTGSGGLQPDWGNSDPYYSNSYFFSEIYQKQHMWSTGSNFYNGFVDQNCFYLNSASLRSFSPQAYNASKYEAYLAFKGQLTGSWWYEGEIEISASHADNLLNAYDTDSAVNIYWPSLANIRAGSTPNWSQLNLNKQNSYGNENEQWGHSSQYGLIHRPYRESNYGWQMPFDENYSTNADTFKTDGYLSDYHDRFKGLEFPCNYTASGGSFSIKLERNGNYNKFCSKDQGSDWRCYFESFSDTMADGQICIGLQGWSKIYSISVKHRYQVLLLDTTDSVSRYDDITESGLLYSHGINKTIEHIGTEVKDPLGYKNILWDEYQNKQGRTGIRPYVQGWTYNAATYAHGYQDEYYNMHRLFQPMSQMLGYYANYQWNNAASEVTVDLGAPVTFDTIGFMTMGNVYGEGSRTTTSYGAGGYMTNIRFSYTLDHSSNFIAGNTASFWGGATGEEDSRTSSGRSGIRFYTGSSAVTAQVIRFQNAGHSKNGTAGCDTGFFGVYNGQSGSTNRQIELKSVDNWKVGDSLTFFSPHHENDTSVIGPYTNYLSYLMPDKTSGYNTMTSDELDAKLNGGLFSYYDITAIDTATNRITLDRDPCYDHLFPGTLALKANRGNIRLKTAHKGLNKYNFKIYQYGTNMTRYIRNVMLDGDIQWYGSANYPHMHNLIENVFIQACLQGRSAISLTEPGPITVRNVITQGRGIYCIDRNYMAGKTTWYGVLNHGGYDTSYHDWTQSCPWQTNFFFTKGGGSTGATWGYFFKQYNSYPTFPTVSKNHTKNSLQWGYYDYMTLNDFRSAIMGRRIGSDGNQIDVYENYYGDCYYRDLWSTSTGYQTMNSGLEKTKWDRFKLYRDSGLTKWRTRAMIPQYGNWITYGLAMGNKPYGVPRFNSRYHNGKNIILINRRANSHSSTQPFCIIEHKPGEYWLEYNYRNTAYSATLDSINTFKECKLYAKEDCTVRIRVNLDYITSEIALHAFDEYNEMNTSYAKPGIVSGFNTPYQKVPRLIILRGATEGANATPGASEVLDVEYFDSTNRDHTNFSYDKTISIKKDECINVMWVCPQGYQYDRLGIIMKYKNLSFDVLTETPEKVTVMDSNWDNEILFSSGVRNALGQPAGGNAEHGANAVVRKVNDITDASLSTVKFNKVRL